MWYYFPGGIVMALGDAPMHYTFMKNENARESISLCIDCMHVIASISIFYL